MLKELKKLFKKDATTMSDGDTIVSDKSEYDFDNQKEIKKIYPNNEGVEVILGFKENNCVEDGRRVSISRVR